ncbi:hypothetical protein EsDP_00004584 [Epichloe bromicola]|uniref:Tc toxin complex TcA C-terminal TcB-binding domain-containing protein n=1 Tax=Epichloe bromicola TaxID=79588 RepID=A0ABQ0CS64_9HYPO
MSNIKPQPQSPGEWKAYATSTDVTSIPLRDARIVDESSRIKSFRGVYFDASDALLPSWSRLNVFTDVLAFTAPETSISPHKNGIIQIATRVITANAPVKIVIPEGAYGGMSIYAAILDQPVTVVAGGESLMLDLGPDSEYAGLSMSFNDGKLEYEYEKKYMDSRSDEFKACLNTQLRIALVQFWKNVSIAISLCSYVATMTTDQEYFNLLNTQAVALGQQLAGQALAGPDMSYAPVLTLARYKETTQNALNAATAFEIQFERFQDKKETAENQKMVWDAMLAQAKKETDARAGLRKSALGKYNDSRATAEGCQKQFEDDNTALESRRTQFERGIEKWKHEQKLKAVFQIFKAVTTFAIGIATLCMGNPGGGAGAVASAEKAVEAVAKAETIAGQVGKFLKSDTMKKLSKCVQALGKMCPQIQSIVDAVGKFELDHSVNIPSMDIISGTAKGDANAAAIVAVASWDKWILESDDQMEFAVGEGIDGATEYRLQLRKHAINGKQLAQAQAESVKAGYEYVQAQIEVIVSQQQIDRLRKLRGEYQGQEAIFALVQSMLYDRAMALRTSVVLSLRNMTWAYRYWALAESTVVLDSRKALVEYQQDLSILISEMENADSRYASDFQPFNYDIKSENLPVDFGTSMKDGIQGSDRTGSFTLAPGGELASVFYEGWHYRLEGLDPTLRGILPKPNAVKDGVAIVKLLITTSGIYADIYKDKIFRFASPPQIRRCSYELRPDGSRGKTRVYPAFETQNHAEPTPFTQWKIRVLNPDDLMLDGLQGIDLQFSGHVRFDDQRRKTRMLG